MEVLNLKEEEMKLRILEEWTGYMGIDLTVLERESIMFVPEKKKESGRISVFSFENKIILIFDPALENIVRPFEELSEFSVEKIPALSGGLLKRGRKTSIKYLNPSNFVPFDPPDEFIVRRLNLGDRTAFYNFRSHCTREDLVEGYVELNHVAVFGAFYEREIVAVSSIIKWGKIADIGIITIPDFRELGLGKALGSKSSEWGILSKNLVQYRHDVLNYGSLKVSRALGFKEYMVQQDFYPAR
jgi:hypothetical protein